LEKKKGWAKRKAKRREKGDLLFEGGTSPEWGSVASGGKEEQQKGKGKNIDQTEGGGERFTPILKKKKKQKRIRREEDPWGSPRKGEKGP